MAKSKLRAECVRLRVEERLSYSEIMERVHVSKGSLSHWLRDYPLTEHEIDEKRWRKPLVRKEAPNGSRAYNLYLEGGERGDKGKIAEAAVLFRAAVLGIGAFTAVFDGESADWLLEVGKKVLKAQVKMARRGKWGAPIVGVRRNKGAQKEAYVDGEFDVLVGYDLQSDSCYVWLWDEVKNYSTGVSVTPDALERWDKLGI